MAILRLKTATQASMMQALKLALLTDEGGELITATHDYWVSIVGALQAPTGVIIEDGENSYPEQAPIPGYHANLVTDDADIIESLQNITIDVDSPCVMIAGE